ncbi:hypothetical protein CONLIGDRAFT_422664 [Coniochaeta ligniaria NRRL 30616]|uniref:Uncharacterized protein n=1 Tax=Coniochaeta ligniaria NRRL 30616 TaxID=1408157 RepID=A0A1J7IJ47_9PEZI|nr:hypothetical protein CONLIGDRAFT_422664 [Coniochaeta ligniaria NRRL 30616]
MKKLDIQVLTTAMKPRQHSTGWTWRITSMIFRGTFLRQDALWKLDEDEDSHLATVAGAMSLVGNDFGLNQPHLPTAANPPARTPPARPPPRKDEERRMLAAWPVAAREQEEDRRLEGEIGEFKAALTSLAQGVNKIDEDREDMDRLFGEVKEEEGKEKEKKGEEKMVEEEREVQEKEGEEKQEEEMGGEIDPDTAFLAEDDADQDRSTYVEYSLGGVIHVIVESKKTMYG